MSYKNIVALVFVAVLLVSSVGSVAAFWHDKPDDIPDDCIAFALKINGVGSDDSADKYNFTEPEDGYCGYFTLEVWILNALDLYAYDFTITCSDAHWGTVFVLDSIVYASFQDALWGVGNWFKIKPLDTYDMSEPYEQAITCKAPGVPPAEDDYQLAELTFHFIDDVCWCEDDIEGWFDICGVLSDSCSTEITTCNTYPVWWRFIPVQPKVYLTPTYEENCVVGDTFTMKVMIANVTKMKSLHFVLRWHGNWVWDWEKWDWIYIKMLCTDEEDITVNDDLFKYGYTLDIDLNDYGTDPAYYSTSELVFDLVVDCTEPLINQTDPEWAVEIEFTKQDPWYCGRQPDYTPVPPHEFLADNATTDIYFYCGYIDVECPVPENQFFGRFFGAEGSTKGIRRLGGWWTIPCFSPPDVWEPCVADFDDAKFEFDAVEGDLDGNGEVDMADLGIIVKYYDQGHAFYPDGAYSSARGYYYDLNKSGIVDIFDVVIVAKHFGDKCVEHTIP